MADASIFEGLEITAASEDLPKRVVAGREPIPNPFVDVVKQSYDAATREGGKQADGVREFTVPVDRKNITLRTQVRKNPKTGAIENVEQWEAHPNVTSALYLLRQAAAKHNLGVRILPDWKDSKVNGVSVKLKDKDGKETGDTETYDDVVKHAFVIKDGRVRIRFLGQKKKDTKKDDDAASATSNENVTSAA